MQKLFKIQLHYVSLKSVKSIYESDDAYIIYCYYMYSWTSFYARDRYSKNRLAYNEFAYKKTKDDW